MKTLTLVPIGGLANRFYAITSAIAFCKDYNIKLRVIWFKDKGMGADFHSLFKLSEDVDKSNVEVIDAKWYHYIYDRPRKRNLWLPWLWQYLLFSKRVDEGKQLHITHEILETKHLYLTHFCQFYKMNPDLSVIKPNEYIESLIKEKKSIFPDRIIGVHIRRGDHQLSIKESPLSVFINKMKKEIELYPDTFFYLASDSLNEKKQLISIFGNRIITDLSPTRRDNNEGIVLAVVELYLLSATKRIYGYSGSTFSVLASQISGIDYQSCHV